MNRRTLFQALIGSAAAATVAASPQAPLPYSVDQIRGMEDAEWESRSLTRTADGYVWGEPQMVAEIDFDSEAYLAKVREIPLSDFITTRVVKRAPTP